MESLFFHIIKLISHSESCYIVFLQWNLLQRRSATANSIRVTPTLNIFFAIKLSIITGYTFKKFSFFWPRILVVFLWQPAKADLRRISPLICTMRVQKKPFMEHPKLIKAIYWRVTSTCISYFSCFYLKMWSTPSLADARWTELSSASDESVTQWCFVLPYFVKAKRHDAAYLTTWVECFPSSPMTCVGAKSDNRDLCMKDRSPTGAVAFCPLILKENIRSWSSTQPLSFWEGVCYYLEQRNSFDLIIRRVFKS